MASAVGSVPSLPVSSPVFSVSSPVSSDSSPVSLKSSTLNVALFLRRQLSSSLREPQRLWNSVRPALRVAVL